MRAETPLEASPAEAPPPGFTAMRPYGPFAVLVGPICERVDSEQVVLGLRVQDKHCNRLDVVHGGMLSTLVDTALAFGVRRAAEARLGTGDFALVTTQISVNFLGNAVPGQWIEAHVEVQRTGRRLGFATCRIHAGDAILVQASGQFMITMQDPFNPLTEQP
ncbi:PaaI family thioesterase [Ideonella sp. B508-1]|uniref:PaaI family thioesterase n=1 Tax=Ideonella sp. B508-1 TaxID=137716 RepID=UPI0003B57F19|nr:PaaI family thioesterase [Ideonella sp. B508-1]